MSSLLKDLDPIKTFKSLPRWQQLLAGAAAVTGVLSLGIVLKIRAMQSKQKAALASYYPNVPHYTAKQVVNCNNKLGECCVWDDRKQLLCWIDYASKQFWTFDPITKESKSYSLPEEPGSFALCDDNDNSLLMCFKSGPAFYDIESKKMSKKLFDFEPNKATRMNDGRCDRFGRFVVGGCVDIFGLNAHNYTLSNVFATIRNMIFGSSSIYRINVDLSHDKLIDGVKCTNSVCFSLDGQTMYYVDAFIQGIRKRKYYKNDEIPSDDELFTKEYGGAGDGSCIDAKGNLWNAHCGIGKVGCFDQNGNVLMVVDVPEKEVTCVAFGGAELDTLYITCLDPSVVPFTKLEKDVGNLYAVKIPNVKGLKENRFKGKWVK